MIPLFLIKNYLSKNFLFHCNLSIKEKIVISNLFENIVGMRNWEDLRVKLDLDDSRKFYWIRIIHTVSSVWKEMFLACGNNISNLIINEHHLIKKHQIFCLEKPNNRELYNMLLILQVEKCIAQTYIEKNF